MQNYNITITGSTPNTVDPNQSSLTLSDNGQTDVDPGDSVTWKIGTGSGLGSIYSINDDVASTDVFGPDASDEPAAQGNSGNWKGTVNPNIARGSMENYTICWLTDSGSGPYCYDPKIQINP